MPLDALQSDTANVLEAEIERGPGWLFIRLRSAASSDSRLGDSIAQNLWHLMQQHLTRRVVLELDDIEVIEDRLLEQIIELNHLVRSHGGMLRLSGMSAQNRDALRDTRLDSQLPHYETRTHAIMTFHGAHRAR